MSKFHPTSPILAVGLAALALAGCAAPTPAGPAPGTLTRDGEVASTFLPVSAAAAKPTGPATLVETTRFGREASVVNLGYAGGKTITLNVLPPVLEGFKAFGLLAVRHHWVSNDVFQYIATLKAWDGAAYAAIGAGVSATVDPKAATPQTKAVFTNLKQGTKYQVDLVAKGNDGGTAADTVLNANTLTTVVYDFTATQDVQDTLADSAAVVFDQVAFSGSATTTINAPADGTFANPGSAEAGVAQ